LKFNVVDLGIKSTFDIVNSHNKFSIVTGILLKLSIDFKVVYIAN